MSLPELQPPLFEETLRTSVESSASLFWLRLDPARVQSGPAECIRAFAGPGALIDSYRIAEALASLPGSRGRCFFLDATAASKAWSEWWDFLDSYQDLMSRIEPCERSVFLAFVHSGDMAPGMTSRTCLAVHRWVPCQPRDLVHYLWAVAGKSFERDREAALRISIASWVSVWDSDLAEDLVGLPIESLAVPQAFLAQHELASRAREWLGADPARLLKAGAAMKVEGEMLHKHAVLLALEGQHAALQRRVWRGQLPEILPFAEEKRIDLIERLGHMLEPMTAPTRNGQEVTEVADLSFGQIAAQVGRRRWQGFSPSEIDHILWLRDARNKLAHGVALDSRDMNRYISGN